MIKVLYLHILVGEGNGISSLWKSSTGMSFSYEAVCLGVGSNEYKSFGRYSPWLLFKPQLVKQSPKGRASLKNGDSC